MNFSVVTNTEAVQTVATAGDPDKLYKTLELELRGHDVAVLKSFVKFATTAGNHLDVQSKR